MAVPPGALLNLQVKAGSMTNNQYNPVFRIESFNTDVVDLADLRIVMYVATNFARQDITLSNTDSGFAFGGATGSTTVTASAEYFDETSGKPPRISTTSYNATSGLFNIKIILSLSTNTLDADGEGFEGMGIRLSHTNFKNWDIMTDGVNRDYIHSYSYESSVSYVDNATFVLEGWDGATWNRLDEVTDNLGTPDASTGAYPYGDTDVDDTTKDHTLIACDSDTYLSEFQNTNNFGSSVQLQLDGGAGRIKRMLMHFNLGGVSGGSLDKAEIWTFWDTISETKTHQLHELTQSFVELEATWNEYSTGNSWTTSGGDYNGTPEQSIDSDRIDTNADNFQDTHWRWEPSNTLINGWIGTTNDGVLVRYNNESAGNVPNLISRDSSIVEKRPFIVLAGYGTATGGGPTRRRITIL